MALGFSVALLHVLCQPRYQPPAPPEPIPVTAEAPPPSPKEPEVPKEEEKPSEEPATQEGAEGWKFDLIISFCCIKNLNAGFVSPNAPNVQICS